MAIVPVGAGSLTPEGGGIRTQLPAQPAKDPFTKVLDQLLGNANGAQGRADQAVQDLVLGRTDEMHNVMLAVAKADLSFRMILELRNRVSDAYQEIMRMQV
jgi:flagellar hook-basal body complex protein FliE